MGRFITNEDLAIIKESSIKTGIATMIEISNKIDIIKQNPIEKATPIMQRDGEPVMYPNSLTIIQGQTGVFKSSLAQIICSAFISEEIDTHQTLGLERATKEPVTLLYADTERNNTEQYPIAIQKILLSAGYNVEDEPDHFDYVSLLQFSRDSRLNFLNKYIELSRIKKKGHIVVVIDIVTDFIHNFNDPNESGHLINLLTLYENNLDISVIAIIHENPNSEKARGHLGTELMNKASSVVQVAFESGSNEVVKVVNKKNRDAARFSTFWVKFDPDTKTLVQADFIPGLYSPAQSKAPNEDVMLWLIDNLKEKMDRSALNQALVKEFNCSSRTIESRLKELIEAGENLPDDWSHEVYLAKERVENTTNYELKDI